VITVGEIEKLAPAPAFSCGRWRDPQTSAPITVVASFTGPPSAGTTNEIPHPGHFACFPTHSSFKRNAFPHWHVHEIGIEALSI
jgi:hypothetical protein